MAALRRLFGRADIAAMCSSTAALVFVGFCLQKVDRIYDLATCSSLFSTDFLLLNCGLSAFLTAHLVCGILLSERPDSKIADALVSIFAAIVGCMIAPFVSAFPPYAAFVCRLLCPEGLYYPKDYGVIHVKRRLYRLQAADWFSLMEVIALGSVAFFEFCIRFGDVRGSELLFLTLLASVAVILFNIRYFRGCRDSIPALRTVASIAFRCIWILFWQLLVVIPVIHHLVATGVF